MMTKMAREKRQEISRRDLSIYHRVCIVELGVRVDGTLFFTQKRGIAQNTATQNESN